MNSRKADDLSLLRDVWDSKPQAWDQLVRRIADTVWASCQLLTGDEQETRQAFSDVMEAFRANRFQRLRSFNGSSKLETFVALSTRDLLADRLLGIFHDRESGKGWVAFERFFGADISRIVSRRLPGERSVEIRKDAYQEICVALISDDYRRLKAYQGKGSFTGFVLHMVDRLLIDFIRCTLSRQPRIAAEFGDVLELEQIPSDQPSPEDVMVERQNEQLLASASEVLKRAAMSLSESEHLYIRIALSSGEPLPAREIARLMCSPVEDVYKLKQRVMSRLRDELERHPVVKMWKASV